MARKHGMMFIETSAKERIGINEAFEEVVNKVLESPMISEATLKKGGPSNANAGKTVKLTGQRPDEAEAASCSC